MYYSVLSDTQLLIGTDVLERGDELKLKLLPKLKYFDNHIIVDYFTDSGIIYGVSETCDGYLMRYEYILSYKVLSKDNKK